MDFFNAEEICSCLSNYVLLKIEEQLADMNLIFLFVVFSILVHSILPDCILSF